MAGKATVKYSATDYAAARPTYPPELFHFITSKTPSHDLTWDAGAGSGQATFPLAKVYKKVIATDISQKQLEFAPKLPNVSYHVTPPTISIEELQQTTGISPSSVDLIAIATALHWMDLPNFYDLVKWALKKPNGLIAAWSYAATTRVNDEVDAVFGTFYEACGPYMHEGQRLTDEGYRTIDFPFGPADGLDHTGPFEFEAQKVMKLEDYLTLIRSWSLYVNAKEKGVELLSDEVVEKFKVAWNGSGSGEEGGERVVKFPVYLRIGKVGDVSY